jgi:hypothetical protein
MRVDRGRLNWGVFFIVLGAVPLAYARGLVSASAVGEAWRLWPLIIVGIGLAFVLSRTPAFFLGGTVVAVCLGLVFGSALAIGPNVGCSSDSQTHGDYARGGTFQGNARVDLDLQCGSATVTTTSDAMWSADAQYSTIGHEPRVTSTESSLRVTSYTVNGWSLNRGHEDWQIKLPTRNQIDLTANLDMVDSHFTLASANLSSARFDLNLGSLHVDLSGATVGSLHMSVNLGSAFVTLDGSSDLAGNLSTNLGSLEVCVPPGLGVQVTADNTLSSSDFAGAGLVRVGGVWRTTNYDTAAHKANLTIETNLGSVKLRAAGGCK